jgi:hypothetical protein
LGGGYFLLGRIFGWGRFFGLGDFLSWGDFLGWQDFLDRKGRFLGLGDFLGPKIFGIRGGDPGDVLFEEAHEVQPNCRTFFIGF